MSSHRKALAVILFFWLPAMILTLSQETGESRDLRLGEEAREDIVREMAGRIRAGESLEVYVDPDALPVAGEEEIYDFPADYFDPSASSGNIGTFSASRKTRTGGIVQGEHADGGSSSEGRASPSENSQEHRAYGTISIPSIGCELPLWEGAGKVELRYGAGRMPGSAEAGASGNLVIFGHRMRRYGSIFNRLGEVRTGDFIIIERAGQIFMYTVDTIDTIEPSSLSAYIGAEKEGDPGSCRITLITCTPIGIGSHRLIITGHLTSGG